MIKSYSVFKRWFGASLLLTGVGLAVFLAYILTSSRTELDLIRGDLSVIDRVIIKPPTGYLQKTVAPFQPLEFYGDNAVALAEELFFGQSYSMNHPSLAWEIEIEFYLKNSDIVRVNIFDTYSKGCYVELRRPALGGSGFIIQRLSKPALRALVVNGELDRSVLKRLSSRP